MSYSSYVLPAPDAGYLKRKISLGDGNINEAVNYHVISPVQHSHIKKAGNRARYKVEGPHKSGCNLAPLPEAKNARRDSILYALERRESERTAI
ncbi:hypothetical protein ACRQ84_20280 (plasmid) [Enterobacter ludwigii]